MRVHHVLEHFHVIVVHAAIDCNITCIALTTYGMTAAHGSQYRAFCLTCGQSLGHSTMYTGYTAFRVQKCKLITDLQFYIAKDA